jgi:hypothetical protein
MPPSKVAAGEFCGCVTINASLIARTQGARSHGNRHHDAFGNGWPFNVMNRSVVPGLPLAERAGNSAAAEFKDGKEQFTASRTSLGG